MFHDPILSSCLTFMFTLQPILASKVFAHEILETKIWFKNFRIMFKTQSQVPSVKFTLQSISANEILLHVRRHVEL